MSPAEEPLGELRASRAFRYAWASAFVATIVIVGLAVCPEHAYAQVGLDNANSVLNTFYTQFQGALRGISDRITVVATRIFWSLATISLVWTGIQLVMRKGDVGEVVGELTRYMMFTGLFFYFVLHGADMGSQIVQGMIDLGTTAATAVPGNAAGTDAAQFMQLGMDLFSAAVKAVSWHPATWLSFLVCLGVIIVGGIIGINFILAKTAGFLLAYAGVFYLGFGGARWTSDVAVSYFKACFACGVRLMTMTILIGLGYTLSTQYVALLGQGVNELMYVSLFFVFLLLFAILANRIPDMMAGIATGHIHSHGVGTYSGSAGLASAVSTGMKAAAGAMAAAIGGVMLAAEAVKGGAAAAKAVGDSSGQSGPKGETGKTESIADSSKGVTNSSNEGDSSSGGQSSPSEAMGGGGQAAKSAGGGDTQADKGQAPGGGPSADTPAAGKGQKGDAEKEGGGKTGGPTDDAGGPTAQESAGWATIGAAKSGQSESKALAFAKGAASTVAKGTAGAIAESLVSGLNAAASAGQRSTLGRIAAHARAERMLAAESKGPKPAGGEVNPQQEIDDFVKGK